MEPKENLGMSNKNSLNFNEAFGACLSKKEYGIFECANHATLGVLRTFNEQDELNFGCLRLERADGYERELVDLDYDPRSFENVIKAAVKLIERRGMKWDLDYLYPGLQMRVGPTLNANGVLEFVLNERPPSYVDRQSGTDLRFESWLTQQLLSRTTCSRQHGQGHQVVPYSNKFLLFRKAADKAPVALPPGVQVQSCVSHTAILCGLLGWTSVYNVPQIHHSPLFNGFAQYDQPYESQINNNGPLYDHYHNLNFPYRPYRVPSNVEFAPYDRHVVREVVDVYDGSDQTDQSTRANKNFAWTKS
ncbi:hypothetical protein HZH66_002528 [Vespula vulgaris]|uniref:Uncharacterized protein n=1 Tax=Vespula vulgaris TaxID=7454 RepID=A0A834KJL1_VESVU|nr:hypothetical protein HZH66_002528 [Vespula vulgaris]